MGGRVIRLQTKCMLKAGDRLIESMQCFERQAEIVVITGIVRIQFDRPLDTRDCRVVVAALMAAHSGQCQASACSGACRRMAA